MLRFFDSFAQYAPKGTSFATINNIFSTGYILETSGGSIVFNDGFETDGVAVYLGRTPSGTARMERRFESTDDVVIIGYEFKSTIREAVTFRIPDVLDLEWPDKMGINGVYGGAIPILNTPYYVELKLTKSTKEVVMKLNGYDYLTTSLPSEVEIPDILRCIWGWDATGATAQMAVSNLYFADGAAGKYTDFIGPVAIKTDRPTASYDDPPTWTPVPPEKTNVQIMNNLPPLASEYTQSDQVNSRDYYTSSNPVTGEVLAVAVSSLVGKTDIDDQRVTLGIEHDDTNREGEEIPVAVQPGYIQTVFEQDALEQDWTAQTAQDVAFGITIQPRA